jgi:glycosyltransferase involved in cell wall biosynthesis
LPTVSVTIPCYNSERFIAETIQSVLDQTFSDFEVVVLDDGSQDRTGEIVRGFADPRIRYFRQGNQGLAKSRNRLIELARGEYIGFLDHDDLWLPRKLQKQMALCRAKPEAALVYSDCYVVDSAGGIVGRWSKRERLYRGWVFEKLLHVNFIPIVTVIMSKTVLQQVGGFLPYTISEEYDVFLKCAARYPFEYVPEPLACYRVHPGQFSKNYEIALRELVAIYQYWSHHDQGQDPNVRLTLRQSLSRAYFNAGKSAIYLDSDPRKAREYFLKALRNGPYWVAALFFALSFAPPFLVRRLRNVVTRALGLYSFSQ